MPIKTTLIAFGAAAAFSASILVASASCSAAPAVSGTPAMSAAPEATAAPIMPAPDSKFFERSIHGTYQPHLNGQMQRGYGQTNPQPRPDYIRTSASASTPGGYLVRRVAARYRALIKWRILAGKYYGPGATRWTLARDKSVICREHNAKVSCQVSARPANLLQRLGLSQTRH